MRASLLIQGEAQNTGLGHDSLVGIENLIGGSAGDRFTGDTQNNVLDGRGGSDTLTGGDGDDLLIIGGGDSHLNGGGGADTVEIYVTSGMTADLGLGGPQDFGFGAVTLKGVENLTASFFSVGEDTLAGDRHDNILAGAGGSDHLLGEAGNDLLLGDGAIQTAPGAFSGAVEVDWFGAGEGLDTLDGGKGADTLASSYGDDLIGGAGRDVFVFQRASETGFVDQLGTIHDLAKSETVDISLIDADPGAAGDQAFHLVSAFTGHVGELVRSYDAETGTTSFMMDTSGAGQADMVIKIDGDMAFFDNFVL